MSTIANQTVIGAAVDLALQGWSVFPCWPHGKSGKAPMTTNGHLDATTDLAQISDWWTARPDAMIGANIPSSLLVLDIDPRNGGSLDLLEAVVGPLPDTVTVTSGRGDGGVHLYFQRPRTEMSRTRLPDGIDLKMNGYMIMPPSAHPDTGLPYRWTSPPSLAPALLPDTARAALRRAPRPLALTTRIGRGAGAGAGLVRQVAHAQEKSRNNLLFWAACRAYEDGIADQILDQLRDAAIGTGLTVDEVDGTLLSARDTAGGEK